MPFRFSYVCDLLEELDQIRCHDPPFLPKDVTARSHVAITRWFNQHRLRIESVKVGVALLSTLLPETRTDRVYGLRENVLEKIIGRALALPQSRCMDLARWRVPGGGDLGDCVQRVQQLADNAPLQPVTVEHIDQILTLVASRCRFSSVGIRSYAPPDRVSGPGNPLVELYPLLKARESKWLTRLVLKSFAPLVLPEGLIYRSYHPMLPKLLKVQSSLAAALSLLVSLRARCSLSAVDDNFDILEHIRPQVGIKVGRQPFLKARSVKNCVDMVKNRRVFVEKKYDGEYQQLHIDMSKPLLERITIFSKSGKDSTKDRIGIHRAIRKCLRLDEPDCKISGMCILEGELLVFSDKDQKILDFHKIRKHVTRSGTSIGTEQDSQTRPYEHLMIVFFDIIAFDDLPVLKISQCERKRLLGNLVEVIPGHAELADSELLDFATPAAAGRLRELFAASIRAGEEGLILRSADDPYFDFESSPGFRSCCVKLKKSYISGLGEIGDFVIVAGGYDATKAKEYTIPNLQWTHFYVGCLENKEAVLQQGAKASFVVIAVTTLGEKLLRSLFFSSPNLTAPFETNEVFDIRIDDGFLDNVKPSWFFPTMPVVELHCFDFEKKGRTRFWSPRFPSVSKIHDDRSYNDTVSFSELQDMAEAARMTPKQAMCEDGTDWNKVLKMADPRGIPVDAVTPPRTAPQRPDLVLGVTPAAGYTIARPETAPIVSNRGQNDAIHAESITALTLTPPSSSEATSGRTEATTERSNLSVTASQNTSADGLRTSKKRRIEAISQGTFGLTVRPHTIAPSSTSQLANESSTPLPSTPHAHSPLSVVSSNRGAGQSTSTAEYHVPVNQPEDLAKEAEENNDPNHKSSLQERPAAPEAETGGGSPQITPVRKRVRATVESPLGMTPSCKHLKHRCALSNCIILMAGCVSGMPYLTSDLLPAHGVAHFSDVERWAKSHMQTGRERKSRRIVLVESHRKEAVLKMFQDIRDLTARSESTTRTQWVEVYDWRLLEAITRIETGKGVPFNPWRKYWVGAISMSQGHG